MGEEIQRNYSTLCIKLQCVTKEQDTVQNIAYYNYNKIKY